MKAWAVSDYNNEYGTVIAFAETRGKAKAICMNDDTFDDVGWTDLRAYRFPQYDQYYDGSKKKINFWFDDEHRVRLVRDFGWQCIDPIDSECEDCSAKQWCSHWEYLQEKEVEG